MSAKGNAEDFTSEIEEWMEEEQRKERPDYRNTVYCDQHLGVKMPLASPGPPSKTTTRRWTQIRICCDFAPSRIVIVTMNPPCSATTLTSQDDD
jgi:hypothetical protein